MKANQAKYDFPTYHRCQAPLIGFSFYKEAPFGCFADIINREVQTFNNIRRGPANRLVLFVSGGVERFMQLGVILFAFSLVDSDIIRIFAPKRRGIGDIPPSFFGVMTKPKTV